MLNASQAHIANTDIFGFTERNRHTIQSIFRQFSSIKEVVLFGSRAVGTFRPYSDIDLCIMNADFDYQQYLSVVAALEESDLPFFTDVLVFYRLQNEELKAEIEANGKILYQIQIGNSQ